MFNNQEPRILIFSMSYLPFFVGGAELANKEITDRISDFQFDLITAHLDKKLPKTEKIGNTNVYRVGLGWKLDKYLFPWLACFKAKKLHQKNNYQLVQAIMAFYAGLAVLLFKKKYPQVKYLLTMQSGDSDFFIQLRTWFWHGLYRKIYTQADYIQAISQYLAKRARKYGYQGEVKIVPNGVDLKKFKIQKSEVKITNQKSKLNIREDEKVIITVSRLVKKNGVGDLIRAQAVKERAFLHKGLTFLKGSDPNEESKKVCPLVWKLLIVGKGPDEKKLKGLVKKLKLQHKVLFIGEIPYYDLPQYYGMADVFVRPSLSEGLGTAFLEAMACGLPVIGTEVGGIPDFLKDRQTGLFCEARNPQSIARKINEILTDEELREKIIENSRRLVQEKYDWDKIALKMGGVFRKLFGNAIPKFGNRIPK